MSDRLTIAAYATVTGFARSTVHRWIADGKLTPHRTPGGKPFFTLQEAMELKNQGLKSEKKPNE